MNYEASADVAFLVEALQKAQPASVRYLPISNLEHATKLVVGSPDIYQAEERARAFCHHVVQAMSPGIGGQLPVEEVARLRDRAIKEVKAFQRLIEVAPKSEYAAILRIA